MPKTRRVMTSDERRESEFALGYRIGRISATRKILIRVLNIRGEPHGVKPGKALIRKINMETDLPLLSKIMYSVIGEELTLAEVERDYDRMFLTPEEIASEKYAEYGDAD